MPEPGPDLHDLSASDRCVKCGLCLPHCPTFMVSGNEADSPRGRISLMQMLRNPQPEWSPGLFRHLDQCLQCRACEAMCPSRVPFGALMDSALATIEPQRKRPPANRFLRNTGLHLVTSPSRLVWFGRALRIYQCLGLDWLLARIPGLPDSIRRMNRLLPPVLPRKAADERPGSGERGEIQLFRGCMGDLFDQQTLGASRRLLEHMGFSVQSPAQQTCCGALHQHNGEPETAARLASTNQQAFSGSEGPVVVTASACAAQLRDYGSMHPSGPAGGFGERVSEILHFLAAQGPGALQFQPLQETVAVQLPCTHRNALKQQQDIFDVLDWIPGMQALPVNADGGCCGAAGTYMLSQPELSDQLAGAMAGKVLETGARVLLTSNIGCSIGLQAALRARGVEVEVLHPVALLERQLIAHPGGHH